MVMLHNLPQRQREVLHFIVRNIEDKHESPTIDEIANGTKLKYQQVHEILNVLEEKKRIKRDKFKHRSITLVEESDLPKPVKLM